MVQPAGGRDRPYRCRRAGCHTRLPGRARSQRDPGHEGNARCLQVFAYYNHGLADSLFACLPAHLEFMAAHRQWSLYYACRSVGIERLLYENKLQTAFREAEQMYDEAKGRGEDYGLGISAYQIASCLYSMRRYEDSYRYFAGRNATCRAPARWGRCSTCIPITGNAPTSRSVTGNCWA